MRFFNKFSFLLFLPLAFYPQFLEKEIYLPDSCSARAPFQIAWDSIRERLYGAGIHGDDKVLVLDTQRDEMLKPIDCIKKNPGCYSWFGYNPINNCLYLVSWFNNTRNDTLHIVNCSLNQVVRKIGFPRRSAVTYCGLAVNTIENKVYLASMDSLYVIDGREHEVRRRFPLKSAGTWSYPGLLFNSANNKLYCLTQMSVGKLYILDGVTDSIGDSIIPSPLFFTPECFTFNEEKNRLYVAGFDTLDRQSWFILTIDCERNQIIGRIEVGSTFGVSAYNPINRSLYLNDGEKIRVVDLSLGRVDSIILSPYCCYDFKINPYQNFLYSLIGDMSDTFCLLAIVDCQNNQIIDYFEVGTPQLPNQVVFLHPLRDILYSFQHFKVGIIDCGNRQLRKEIYTGGSMFTDIFFNPLTNKFHLTLPMYPLVFVGNILENRGIGVLNFRDYVGWEWGFWSGAVCTQLNKIYISQRTTGNVIVLDGNTDSILGVIPLPGAKDLYYWEEVNKIFAIPPHALSFDPYTYVIDCSTDVILAQIRTGLPTSGVAYSPRTNKVYIAAGYGGYENTKTTIIDATNHRVVMVIPGLFGDIEYDPRFERFYISDGWPPPYLFRAKRVDFTNVRDTSLPPGLIHC